MIKYMNNIKSCHYYSIENVKSNYVYGIWLYYVSIPQRSFVPHIYRFDVGNILMLCVEHCCCVKGAYTRTSVKFLFKIREIILFQPLAKIFARAFVFQHVSPTSGTRGRCGRSRE